jgi:hypothetical protein
VNEPARTEQVAAIQGHVRRAGSATRWVRHRFWTGAGGVFCSAPVLALLAVGVTLLLGVGSAAVAAGALALLILVGMATLIFLPVLGSVSSDGIAAWYRRLRQRRLRKELASLPQEALAEALLPLQADACPDSRAIVAPLIRELGLQGHELIPAAAPPGTGSEPAAPSAGDAAAAGREGVS